MMCVVYKIAIIAVMEYLLEEFEILFILFAFLSLSLSLPSVGLVMMPKFILRFCYMYGPYTKLNPFPSRRSTALNGV